MTGGRDQQDMGLEEAWLTLPGIIICRNYSQILESICYNCNMNVRFFTRSHTLPGHTLYLYQVSHFTRSHTLPGHTLYLYRVSHFTRSHSLPLPGHTLYLYQVTPFTFTRSHPLPGLTLYQVTLFTRHL